MTTAVWLEAAQTLIQPSVIFFLFAGVFIGTMIGAMPGLSATMGIAIMTPITFWFSPVNGFAMLMGLWNAAIFSGGIAAILINTPGTPASITQSFDGYALYKQGKGGLALGVNVIFSAMGGLISTLCLILFAGPIAKFTIKFGPTEYFMLALFGLSMMIAVSGGNVLKGLVIGAMGILLSCIGLDPILSVKRFTMGQTSLLSGISFIPVMIGMFGIGEVLYQIYNRNKAQEEKEQKERKVNLQLGKVLPSGKEMASITPRCIVSALAATVIGAIPAAGGDIASIICWGNAKKVSKHPEEYGKGSVEGLAISSSANNGVIGGAMTTMMTLGIPGDSVTAILIGSLTMYGMQPGIKMFTEHASFTAQIMLLMLLANIVFLVFGLLTVKASAKVLNVAQPTVWAAVSVLCVVGAYALNNNFFDVIVMLIAAVLGFLFKVYKFPTGPFILGLLLGGMLESNMRRALVMSHGSYMTFISRPVSCVLLVLIVITFLSPLIKMVVIKKKPKASIEDSV
ncbi:MAG: tripartite tricarboxylate transporter permease [Spirochaetales bacterium]|nr:tripartite tricarboxylate transporter permease [Spirochaetales bacterium]